MPSFLTNLNNVFTVSESARGEEQASRPHTHPIDFLLAESIGGMRNLTAADFAMAPPAVIRAEPEVSLDCWRPYSKKLKIQNNLTITFLFCWGPLGLKDTHSVSTPSYHIIGCLLTCHSYDSPLCTYAYDVEACPLSPPTLWWFALCPASTMTACHL